MTQSCYPLSVSGTYWDFCPSIAAAYTLLFLFLITTCVHVAQAFMYRKTYSWVIIVSGLLQTLTYIFRVLSIYNPASFGDYAAWFVLILIAPVWTNAYVYMVLGRMIWNFSTDAKLLGIKPWNYGTIFVCLDIIAFIIQVVGAANAADAHAPVSQTLKGIHTYMGGVGAQQGFILLFSACVITFHLRFIRQGQSHDRVRVLRMVWTVYAVLTLISIRIIFRLIEYSSGLNSTIPQHEAYQYCLDSLPMLIASILLNIIHPGHIMPGKESDLPSRKARKDGGGYRSDASSAQNRVGEDLDLI